MEEDILSDLELVIKLFQLLLSLINIVNVCGGRINRRMWVREIYTTRNFHGFSKQTFKIIKQRDHEHFRKATRMSPVQFDVLFSLIEHRLVKISNREPIDAETRLAVTLLYSENENDYFITNINVFLNRYLSQGAPMQILAWSFKMGLSTVREIIYETCNIIWELLSGLYLSPPNKTDWESYERGFFGRWNFPNCIGAIDGKHINIKCPPNAGSTYFNYKGHHSIVLLAACDDNYCFTAVDIGALGSRSDGGIFASSVFGKKVLNGELPPLPDKQLPNSNITFPHFFVADAAFPLRRNIMRPYSARGLTGDEEYFNKRLSRARRIIENAFGILAARWRILTTTINAFPKNAEKIVMATCVLHNFCKFTEPEVYCPESFIDSENGEHVNPGGWRDEISNLNSIRNIPGSNCPREAFNLRDKLKEYINQHVI